MKLQKDPKLHIPADLYDSCYRVFELVADASGQAFLVGGCVRDALLGHSSKDIDIEVYGLEEKQLVKLLRQHFQISEIGKSFGILKIQGSSIDIALPRRESKSGSGHKGFNVQGDPALTHTQASSRRDFTMNAILWDFLKGEFIDPFNGRRDLQDGILRHTSNHFSEDPLRVLRAMQFAARFNLKVAPETIDLCKSISPEHLSAERIYEEWKKLITKGETPSLGLNFLQDCGWIRHYPELDAMVGCKQDPDWHPEGDVWTHTLHCMDAFSRGRLEDSWENLIVGFSVLCHDMGKPATTKLECGRIRSPGHESAGASVTRVFLARMTRQKALIAAVVPLVANHLRPLEFFQTQAGDSAIRRLARKVKRIDRLIRVAKADMQGRPPKEALDFPAGEWLLSRAELLEVSDTAPKPIVLGRHLIELGFNPGRLFSVILEECYNAQLDSKFNDLEGGKKHALFIADELDIHNPDKNIPRRDHSL